MADLEEVKRRLLTAFPAARRILLFGSRAKGDARLDSDYDVLVVTPSDLRPALRCVVARRALYGLPAAFDLIVLTPDEFDREREFLGGVVRTAAREGKVLHEAA
jgi:predicted nucleotidyltransferase